ncbi:MAG: hypothetical protein ACRCX2_22930 [Paraclostridium sp.]
MENEKIVIEILDSLSSKGENEILARIYLKVKKLTQEEEVRKIITKNNIKKYLNNSHHCDICNTDMKKSYKYIHNRTKKHVENESKNIQER